MRGRAPDINLIEGEVRRHVFQGDSTVLYIAVLEGRELAVRQSYRSDEEPPAPGSPVRIGIAPRDTVVVPADEIAAEAPVDLR